MQPDDLRNLESWYLFKHKEETRARMGQTSMQKITRKYRMLSSEERTGDFAVTLRSSAVYVHEPDWLCTGQTS
ncbi:hypothetical protein AOLI_G00231830 [Acnodon oligacanthus]